MISHGCTIILHNTGVHMPTNHHTTCLGICSALQLNKTNYEMDVPLVEEQSMEGQHSHVDNLDNENAAHSSQNGWSAVTRQTCTSDTLTVLQPKVWHPRGRPTSSQIMLQQWQNDQCKARAYPTAKIYCVQTALQISTSHVTWGPGSTCSPCTTMKLLDVNVSM